MICKTCKDKVTPAIGYSEEHDAYFCGTCDSWLESSCDDDTCTYCVGRPEKPSQWILESERN